MRETLLPLLRDNYPKIAKDLLGGLLDVLTQARIESGGDLDKFQVFLVVAMRTVEDRRFAELQFDDVLSGEVAAYPSLHTNIRSIAESPASRRRPCGARWPP
ncbi:MAG: hypothetical protein ABW360_10570 [Phenylobacterium sp.]